MSESVLKQLTELSKLESDGLKAHWRLLFGSEPPGYNRGFLIKRLAYRIQELRFGGIDSYTRVKMDAILNQDGYDEIGVRSRYSQKSRNYIPVPGTCLIREWKGRRCEVVVLRDGFQFEGRKYRSLSAIAREITGKQWNGLVFFGLKSTRKELK